LELQKELDRLNDIKAAKGTNIELVKESVNFMYAVPPGLKKALEKEENPSEGFITCSLLCVLISLLDEAVRKFNARIKRMDPNFSAWKVVTKSLSLSIHFIHRVFAPAHYLGERDWAGDNEEGAYPGGASG
jgi:hypothetical protein